MKDCLNNIQHKVKHLTKDEVQALAKEVEGVIGDSQVSGRSVDETVSTMLNQYNERLVYAKQKRALMEQAYKRQEEFLDQFADNPERGIESMMASTYGKTKYEGAGNISRTRQALSDIWIGSFMTIMERHPGLEKRFKSGELDVEIYRYHQTGDASGLDKGALALAQSMKKVQNMVYNAKRKAGYRVKYLEEYTITTKHNPKGMRNLKERGWKELARRTFDWERMGVASADREAYLTTKWQQMSQKDVQNFWDISDDFTSLKTENAIKKIEEERFIHFKSPEKTVEYNRALGNPPLAEQFVRGLMKDAGSIAAAQHLSPQHKQVFNKLISTARRKAASNGKTINEPKMRRLYQLAVESIDHPEKNFVAMIGDTMRKITNMSKLGGALVTTATDFAYAPAIISGMTGKNFLQVQKDVFTDSVKFFQHTGRSKEFAAQLGVMGEEIIGMMQVNRFGDDMTGSDWFNKSHNAIMRMSGLPRQSRALRLSIMKRTSQYIHELSSLPYKELSPGMQEWFGRFGVTDQKWNILREAFDDFGDGTKGVTMSSIDNLMDVHFHREGVTKPGDISRTKMDLKVALSSFLSEASEIGSPTPGIRVAELKARFDPNTVMGQAALSMLQFKSFALAMAQTMKAINTTGTSAKFGNIKATGQAVASATALGYMVLAAKNYSKGKEAPDFGPETFVRSAIQGGAGMIYADFLLADYTKSYISLAGNMAGPAVTGVGTDIAVALSSLSQVLDKHGNYTPLSNADKKRVLDVFERNMPGKSIALAGNIVTRAAFREIHEYLNTGRNYKDTLW